MNYQESQKKIADHATQLYLQLADERLYFHNLGHVARVLDAIRKMNAHYRLDEKSLFILSAAAWLYDLEIISSGRADRNIEKIILPETGYLKEIPLGPEEIEAIKKCMTAGAILAEAASLPEKIMADAQRFYFGSGTFFAYHKLLRKEIEAFSSNKIKGDRWLEKTISLFENHQFQTEYGQSLLSAGKANNLDILLKKLEEKYRHRQPAHRRHQGGSTARDQATHANPLPPDMPAPTGEFSKMLKGPVEYDPDGFPPLGPAAKKVKHHLRGVETMFRNSSSNHQRLSVMADNKAFIMISVNSILITVGIGLIIGKFVLIPKLFIPTVILLSVNVLTIIYAVLATRPGFMKGTFTRQEVAEKTVDLLFFGSFYKMPLSDFEYGMRQMMDDSEFLYGTLIKDIYLQGKVLGRKFRLLRTSYDLFMYGTVLTVIAYIISFFF